MFYIWAAFNTFGQYQNFFFQEVQGISSLEAAIRFLPALISGALTHVVIEFVVQLVRADWIVIATTILCLLASVLMAIAQPSWSYCAVAFSANLLNLLVQKASLQSPTCPSHPCSRPRHKVWPEASRTPSLRRVRVWHWRCRPSCGKSGDSEFGISYLRPSTGSARGVSCSLLILCGSGLGEFTSYCVGLA